MKTELKKLPKSQIEVTFELDAEEFNKHIDAALLHLKDHVKMDGFRKGQVPKEMVEKRVGQESLLMEAGDLAVKEAYAKFVREADVEPIGDPEVQIKKIAKGSEFVFVVKVSVLPEIALPDYKAIAEKIAPATMVVEEKEIQEALEYLQRSRAKFTAENREAGNNDFVEITYTNEHINSGKEVKDRFILGQGGFMKDFEQNIIGMKVGDKKEFSAKMPDNHPNKDVAGKESVFKVTMSSVQKMELPALDDVFAKELGMFDSLVALKDNLKEGITAEKQESERQRARGEILTKIAEKIEFDLPENMLEFEKERLFEDLKMQVASQFNIPFEEYLSSVKKTEQEIKDSYKVEAERRIKNFLVLRQIGKAEAIEVNTQELQEEMNKAVKNQPKEQVEKIDINRLRDYSKSAVFNEKVFLFLENLSKNTQ